MLEHEYFARIAGRYEEEIVDKTLKTLLGKDNNGIRGYVELHSSAATEAIESMVYAVIRGKQAVAEAACMNLLRTIQNIAEIEVQFLEAPESHKKDFNDHEY